MSSLPLIAPLPATGDSVVVDPSSTSTAGGAPLAAAISAPQMQMATLPLPLGQESKESDASSLITAIGVNGSGGSVGDSGRKTGAGGGKGRKRRGDEPLEEDAVSHVPSLPTMVTAAPQVLSAPAAGAAGASSGGAATLTPVKSSRAKKAKTAPGSALMAAAAAADEGAPQANINNAQGILPSPFMTAPLVTPNLPLNAALATAPATMPPSSVLNAAAAAAAAAAATANLPLIPMLPTNAATGLPDMLSVGAGGAGALIPASAANAANVNSTPAPFTPSAMTAQSVAQSILQSLPPPVPFFTPQGLFMSEPDPFGTETPSQLKFKDWAMLDEFIKILSIRNGFRHVLRRSHKDEKGQYKHGTYVCEFHASPTEPSASNNGPTRASSRSIRLSCPYKINFARQGETGHYHVNKRVMHHSHVIDSSLGVGPPMALPLPHMIQNAAAAGINPMNMALLMNQTGLTAPAAPSITAPPMPNVTNPPSLAGPASQPLLRNVASPGVKTEQLANLGNSTGARVPALKSLLQAESHPQESSSQSITELQNPISAHCDQLSNVSLVRSMRECDSQLFNGALGLPGLFDSPCIESSSKLIDAIGAAFKDRANSRVIISGAGTSGRLAWFASTYWNQMLSKSTKGASAPLFHYLNAGGDKTLLMSETDGAEDDADRGRQDLKSLLGHAKNIVFIGITCGLSAPYVAGQLDYCMELFQQIQVASSSSSSSSFNNYNITSLHTSLIGFTPVSRARDNLIERWTEVSPAVVSEDSRSFRAVAKRLEMLATATSSQSSPINTSDHFSVLTPVVGPEFITGSTRLKGGSATLILLETLISSALEHKGSRSPEVRASYLRTVQGFESAFRQTYQQSDKIAQLIEDASASLGTPPPPPLPNRGHLYYVSLSASLGRVAFIDSSEMDNTFGSGHEQVRAFWLGGLKSSLPKESMLFDQIKHSPSAPLYHTSLTDLARNIGNVNSNDMVIVLSHGGTSNTDEDSHVAHSDDANWSNDESVQLIQNLAMRGAKMVSLLFSGSGSSRGSSALHPVLKSLQGSGKLDSIFRSFIDVPLSVSQPSGIVSFSCKLILNILTTGAHIRNGFVLSNRMIHLVITNSKLYHRAVGIVADLTGLTTDAAERQVLRAIYQVDTVTEDLRKTKVSAHVERAASNTGVLSLALLLAECESSRLPSLADNAATPAITIVQASRRLEKASFKQLMETKYSKAAPSAQSNAAAAVAAAVAAAANSATSMDTRE